MNNQLTQLELREVTKYYGTGSNVVKALDNVSFDIKTGEFVAVMGASGSGKSTLLNVISTIDKLSGGDILLEGDTLTKLKEKELSKIRRDRLGFIFQEYNLIETLTIGENIALPLQLRGTNSKTISTQVDELSQLLGIADLLSRFPRELSGGQKQRAAVVRALITKPSIILADEPTGALDSNNSISLMKSFNTMNTDLKATILMVTHDALMGSYASRVIFLKDGKIYNEIYKGDKDRKSFYKNIVEVMTLLGGADDE